MTLHDLLSVLSDDTPLTLCLRGENIFLKSRREVPREYYGYKVKQVCTYEWRLMMEVEECTP